MNNKVGVVVTFKISAGGGAPRVTIDLINALKAAGKEVHLMTPFPLDKEIIEKFHGSFEVDKFYYPGPIKAKFCKESTSSRGIMKKEFLELVNNVDLIIDIDGGVIHNYLPKNYNGKYIVWKISCVIPESEKFPEMRLGFKGNIKKFIKELFVLNRPKPSEKHKIYPLDKWTAGEIKDFWNLESTEPYLYPEIKVDEFDKSEKKDQIVVFGRIAPNKFIEKSIKIFAKGTKKFKDYNLVIMGGVTPETKNYKKKLQYLIKKLSLENKVEIIEDISFERLRDILSESKVLIDSQNKVSLTMTAIEAMAAGCVPLVIRECGNYLDIINEGEFGYSFEEVDEGGMKLEIILDKLDKGGIDINKSIKRAHDFNGKKFKETVVQILADNGLENI
jgi:glycosyltransferase involved in cell wall biosynthesis